MDFYKMILFLFLLLLVFLPHIMLYDTSKRVIINPRNFGGAEINTTTDTINIPDHGYETGDKIYILLRTLQHLLQRTLFILLLK